MNTALLELAQQLTADNLDEAMDGLAYEVADTFLEELDEDNIRVRFRELMTNSIFYTLSRRCGQEPMDVLDDDDFIRIVDFNKLPVLSFLGNAVSEQCEAVLFDIGREMRKIYKKEITQQLEKSVDSLYNTNTDFNALKRETKENTTKGGQENGVDVLPQGRLSVPESGREGRAADYREVRDAAQDVPEREPQELVSEYADERQAEPASGADRGSSGESGGNPAGQPEREVSGTKQGEGPAGMGGTPEQPDGDGRRDRFEGIGIQLTEPTTEQDLSEAEEEIASAFSFPDLPTVEQQIRAIEAPIQARYADEIALDSEVVDEILRTGSNRSKGQLRLIYNFMVEKTPEESLKRLCLCRITAHRTIRIILHESGAFVTQTALGFDGEATRKMSAFLQGPKPELLHHQKFFENGTAERAKESGTEQNYNMIDGCVNNVPKKPRRIGGRWSVLDRLHIKQAERRQKDNTPQQEQERSRKS